MRAVIGSRALLDQGRHQADRAEVQENAHQVGSDGGGIVAPSGGLAGQELADRKDRGGARGDIAHDRQRGDERSKEGGEIERGRDCIQR